MIDWNPVTRPYCAECPHYQCVGNYVYELERDPKMRKYKHLARCKWASDKSKKLNGEMGGGTDGKAD